MPSRERQKFPWAGKFFRARCRLLSTNAGQLRVQSHFCTPNAAWGKPLRSAERDVPTMCPRWIRTEASGHMDALVNSAASFQHPARISSGGDAKTARVAETHDDDEAGETSVDIIWPDKAFEFAWQQVLSQPGTRTPAPQVQATVDSAAVTADSADAQTEVAQQGFPDLLTGQVAVPTSEAANAIWWDQNSIVEQAPRDSNQPPATTSGDAPTFDSLALLDSVDIDLQLRPVPIVPEDPMKWNSNASPPSLPTATDGATLQAEDFAAGNPSLQTDAASFGDSTSSSPSPAVPQLSAQTESPAVATSLSNANFTSQPLTTQVLTALAQRLSSVVEQTADSLTLRLDPPELGEVDVQFQRLDDGITIRVTAKEAVTMEMLMSRGAEIERLLRNQNPDVQKFEFHHPNANGESNFGESANQSSRRDAEARHNGSNIDGNQHNGSADDQPVAAKVRRDDGTARSRIRA